MCVDSGKNAWRILTSRLTSAANKDYLLISMLLLAIAFPAGDGLADSDLQTFARFSLGLSGREGRTLSHCKPLQDQQSYFFAARDCNFSELALYASKDLFQIDDEDDIWVRAHASLLAETQMLRDWADTSQPEGEGLRLSQRSFFVEFGNSLASRESFWIGRRRYQTIYFRILDLYALDVSGPGFGLERTSLGNHLDLSTAFFRNVSQFSGPVQDTIDVRLSWRISDWQKFDIAALYSQTGRESAEQDEQRYRSMQGIQTVLWHQLNATRFELWSLVQAGQGLFGAEDGRLYSEGPAASFNQFGSNRRYTFLQKDIFQAERRALQRSKSIRLAQQFRWLPIEQGWMLEAGWAYQSSDFGGLSYIDSSGRIWQRPDSHTEVIVLTPSYEFSPNFGIELSASRIQIQAGLGQGRILRNGSEQSDMSPVDRRLDRQSLSLKWRPLGWGNAQLRLFYATQSWNQSIAADLSRSIDRLKTSSYAGGLTFDMWW